MTINSSSSEPAETLGYPIADIGSLSQQEDLQVRQGRRRTTARARRQQCGERHEDVRVGDVNLATVSLVDMAAEAAHGDASPPGPTTQWRPWFCLGRIGSTGLLWVIAQWPPGYLAELAALELQADTRLTERVRKMWPAKSSATALNSMLFNQTLSKTIRIHGIGHLSVWKEALRVAGPLWIVHRLMYQPSPA
jgi:hypothetical protein